MVLAGSHRYTKHWLQRGQEGEIVERRYWAMSAVPERHAEKCEQCDRLGARP